MIDVELLREMVALAKEPGLLIPFADEPDDDPDDLAKGVLGSSFGNSSKRRNELVSRLKGRHNYAPPVRGGKKKRRGRLTTKGNLTRALTARRSATTMKGMRSDTTLTKHYGPGNHPGTGTPQTVHSQGGDFIPAQPGETPIPENTHRMYHVTAVEHLESIQEHGLQVSQSRGESYGEPSLVWFSNETDYWKDPDRTILVEVAIPDERIQNMGIAISGGPNGNMGVPFDIPTDWIVAIHEPWHSAYHFLSDPGSRKRVVEGFYDNILEDESLHSKYGRAIERIKAEEGAVAKHAAPIHPGTGTDQSVHGGGGSKHTTSGGYDAEVAAKEDYDPETYRLASWDMLPELPEGQYWITPSLLDSMQGELDRLNKRGQRYLNIPEDEALKVVKTGRTHAHTTPAGQVVSFESIAMEGTIPNASGYQFIAKLEHLQNEDGSYTNILKAVPGLEADIPVEYRTAGPNCDVCKRNIYRRDTFLVRNVETGEIIQAGRDDLALYTGFDEAEQLANWTSRYADWVSRLESTGRSDREVGAYEFGTHAQIAIAQTAAIVRAEGFVRSGEIGSTKEALNGMLNSQAYRNSNPNLKITDADFEKADKIMDWVSGLEDDQLASDYLWNLKVAATNPYGVTGKQYGLIASIVTAYDREMGLIIERERAANLDALSDFVGEVGKRQDFPDLTITRHNTFEGNYGTTHVYEFIDSDNNSLVWFSSNSLSRDVPDTARIEQERAFVEEGRELFESKIVPAGGSIEGVVSVVGGTAGRPLKPLRDQWVKEGRITPEIEESARAIWFGGSSYGPHQNAPQILDQSSARQQNAISAYVHSTLIDGRLDYTRVEHLDIGDVISLKATVKEHKVNEYKGREKKQTVITRGKLLAVK